MELPQKQSPFLPEQRILLLVPCTLEEHPEQWTAATPLRYNKRRWWDGYL